MSIINKSVVECILKGQGHTDEQVKQLARAWLTMPSVQPMHEQNARFAIDGAIAFGKAGINKPEADDHWLLKYWEIGQELAQASYGPADLTDQFKAGYNSGVMNCVERDTTKLLDIARKTGLRQHLHGVNATVAKQLLSDFVDELVKTAQPAPEQIAEKDAGLEWLAKNLNCELSHVGEDDDSAWVVHRVTGSRNDREWREIGRGSTPSAAIAAAMKGAAN